MNSKWTMPACAKFHFKNSEKEKLATVIRESDHCLRGTARVDG